MTRRPFAPLSLSPDVLFPCFPPLPETVRARAFTLLELMTTMIVVAILLVMLFPVYTQIIRRMQRTSCMANLRSLAHRRQPVRAGSPDVAADRHERAWTPRRWRPTGSTRCSPTDWPSATGFARPSRNCCSIPDLDDPENARIDYTATPFDRNPMTPFRWSRQPWFIENGDVHGNGNLIIFPDGHIQEVGDFLSMIKKAAPTAH